MQPRAELVLLSVAVRRLVTKHADSALQTDLVLSANGAHEELIVRFAELYLVEARALQASAQARRLQWNEGLALLAMGCTCAFGVERVGAQEDAARPRDASDFG